MTGYHRSTQKWTLKRKLVRAVSLRRSEFLMYGWTGIPFFHSKVTD